MLFIGVEHWYDVALICASAVVGIVGVSAGMEGYMFTKCSWWQRLMLLSGGLLSIIPGIATDVAGLALIATVFLIQKLSSKKDLTPPVNTDKSEAA